MKKSLLVAVSVIFLLSCRKSNNNIGPFVGPDATIQQGKGRTWVTLDPDGAPLQLAISVDDSAMNSMPTTGNESKVTLELSAAAKLATPFDHVAINWNPHGHDPVGIYDKPHFDFHFYMASETEVMNATDTTLFTIYPPATYLPANYVPGPYVPEMGEHFIDITSPELNGQPFTQTFIYGTYNRTVTFYEPMATLAFLKSTTGLERSIPQPEKYKRPGYYPTKLNFTKHDGVTDIILGGFVKRPGS